MKNRIFFLVLSLTFLISCKEKTTNQKEVTSVDTTATSKPFFKISLAEWSLHAPIMEGKMDPMDFAEKANEMGFEGIEYVSQLYTKKTVKLS